MRREPFEPRVVIGVQSPLVVIDEHRCGDAHGVDQYEAFSNAAFFQGGLDLRGNVEKRPAPRRLELKFLAITTSQSSVSTHKLTVKTYRLAPELGRRCKGGFLPFAVDCLRSGVGRKQTDGFRRSRVNSGH
jgi:hypothetical protein